VKSSVDSQLTEMQEAGATVSVPEIGPFREAVQPVYAKAKDVYGAEAVDNILADAAAIREKLPAQN